MDMITQLTHLAYQFGPFAFALIFLILMARWGQKNYSDACMRSDPPATPAEQRTYLLYFLSVTAVGVILVGLSVYWWWNHQPQYLYEGQIDRLAETDTIEGQNFFVRNEYYQQDKDNPGPQIRDVHFVLVHKEPFKDGQELNLRHFRDRRLAKPLVLRVRVGRRLAHVLDYDPQKDEWIIKAEKDAPITNRVIISTAFAKSPSEQRIIPQAPALFKMEAGDNFKRPASVGTRGPTPATIALVKTLQDPQTQVSTKVELLDQLQTVSFTDLAGLFRSEEFVEPVFVTLLDLTRHTDREVATKAGRLITKAPLPVDYFASLLGSKDSRRRAEAPLQFMRLDPEYASKLLTQLEQQRVDVGPIMNAVKARNKPWLMVPTGTSSGDKYFVKAQWTQGTEPMIGCLAKLFNSFAIGGKTAQQNLDFTVSQRERYVFDSNKIRTLEFAKNVEKCGATATFVGYYTNRK